MLAAVVRRLPMIAGALSVLVAALMLSAYLYDSTRGSEIAKGVRIAGVDVGGLSAGAAAARVRSQIVAPLEQRPVLVTAAGRQFTLTPQEAEVAVNVPLLVDQAVNASRRGWFLSRAVRDVFGGSVRRQIASQASYSHQAVHDFIAVIKQAVNRPPSNATVQPSATGLRKIRQHDGAAVNQTLLGRRIEFALTNPTGPHTLAAPARVIKPTITTAQLARRYPAYIVIDRSNFVLRFYQHLKLADTYPIAVGMQGLETPAGLYSIQWKQVDPPWYVPNSAWAGSLAGQVIPPGPLDPIKARWMAFNGGDGIHGIDPSEYSSIGHDASHGCVRMRIPDVIALYSRAPVGTPVYVA
jgi:lipoprotein-anchoring transpeptidase ErfK/SrfK